MRVHRKCAISCSFSRGTWQVGLIGKKYGDGYFRGLTTQGSVLPPWQPPNCAGGLAGSRIFRRTRIILQQIGCRIPFFCTNKLPALLYQIYDDWRRGLLSNIHWKDIHGKHYTDENPGLTMTRWRSATIIALATFMPNPKHRFLRKCHHDSSNNCWYCRYVDSHFRVLESRFANINVFRSV